MEFVKFDSMLEWLAVPAAVLDDEFNVRSANSEFRTLSGQGVGGETFLNILNLFDFGHQEKVNPGAEQLITKLNNGQLYHFNLTSKRLQNENGQDRYLLTLSNVSKYKSQEQMFEVLLRHNDNLLREHQEKEKQALTLLNLELTQKAQELEKIFEASSALMGIVEVSEKGIRQILQNSLSSELFGAQTRSTEKLYQELGVSDEECQLWKERYLACKSANRPLEFANYNKETKKHLSTTVNFVGNSSNGCPRFIYISHDITPLKLAEKAREKHLAQMAVNTKMAALGEMASSVAHEICNPITIIKGYADLLEKRVNKSEVEQRELLPLTGAIREACVRVAAIVEGLQYFSGGGPELKIEELNLRKLTELSLRWNLKELVEAGVSVDFADIDPILSIHCKSVQFSQILSNMVHNSIFAMKASQHKKIEIKAWERANQTILTFKDSGPGIVSEHQSKIFNPFFTTKGIGQGTGMGLSICKGFMESLGGEIKLQSTHSGTTFELVFPKHVSAILSSTVRNKTA